MDDYTASSSIKDLEVISGEVMLTDSEIDALLMPADGSYKFDQEGLEAIIRELNKPLSPSASRAQHLSGSSSKVIANKRLKRKSDSNNKICAAKRRLIFDDKNHSSIIPQNKLPLNKTNQLSEYVHSLAESLLQNASTENSCTTSAFAEPNASTSTGKMCTDARFIEAAKYYQKVIGEVTSSTKVQDSKPQAVKLQMKQCLQQLFKSKTAIKLRKLEFQCKIQQLKDAFVKKEKLYIGREAAFMKQFENLGIYEESLPALIENFNQITVNSFNEFMKLISEDSMTKERLEAVEATLDDIGKKYEIFGLDQNESQHTENLLQKKLSPIKPVSETETKCDSINTLATQKLEKPRTVSVEEWLQYEKKILPLYSTPDYLKKDNNI